MSADSQPIVLIHGMWMTPRSWDNWVDHYADRGYGAIAPGWPGVKDPEETRRDPSALKGLGIKQVVDHYEEIIRGLDRPPIIIGHSFGGLFTQLLLDRGLGATGVAVGTATPKGVVLLPPSTLRAGLPALKNPFNRNGLCPLTEKQFRWRFTNTLSQDESDARPSSSSSPSSTSSGAGGTGGSPNVPPDSLHTWTDCQASDQAFVRRAIFALNTSPHSAARMP